MRLRNIPGAGDVIEASPYCINEPNEYKGSWKSKIFGNDKPLYIEIGMGKGRFIIDNALAYPDINFIGIERYTSVLLRAVQKVAEQEIPNLRFICIDAALLADFFEKGEVDKIYLNFSDPWPKDRHSHRRLTSEKFLSVYDQVLKADGVIEFKTDNTGLFDFSLETIKESTIWQIQDFTYDLHNEPRMNEGNIMTEYEEKFSSLGNPIHKLIACRE